MSLFIYSIYLLIYTYVCVCVCVCVCVWLNTVSVTFSSMPSSHSTDIQTKISLLNLRMLYHPILSTICKYGKLHYLSIYLSIHLQLGNPCLNRKHCSRHNKLITYITIRFKLYYPILSYSFIFFVHFEETDPRKELSFYA